MEDLLRHPVLVADDEADTREAILSILEFLGFEEVDAVGDGAEAIRRAEEAAARGEPYRLVILDHRMPKVSGVEALPRLLAALPRARVVLCSGFERWQLDASVFESGRVQFLQKPMSVEQFEDALRQIGVALPSAAGGPDDRQYRQP